MTDREAMKLALEALEDIHPGNMTPMAEEYWGKAITALRQALAEPDMGIDRGAWDDVPDATKWVDELRGDDETEEEPVGQYSDIVSDGGLDPRNQYDTAPPKREWVGLTYEEISASVDICEQNVKGEFLVDYARAIEAKLREKNGF
jgi:hypothetical protein